MLSQPQHVTRPNPNFANIATLYDNHDWRANRGSNVVIKQAIIYNKHLYAISEDGELVSGDCPIRQNIKELTVINSFELMLVLEDRVVCDECDERVNDMKTIYKGPSIRVYTGSLYAFLKTQDGYLFYGNSYHGQSGNGNREYAKFLPVQFEFPIQELYTGGWQAYAKSTSGKFYAWGYNYDGRLGNNGTNHVYFPEPVNYDQFGIVTLACGAYHTMGLTNNGDVYVWGMLRYGNLGMTPKTPSNGLTEPHLLLSGYNIINLFTGPTSQSTYAQTSDGTMLFWGRNYNDMFFQTKLIDEKVKDEIEVPTICESLCGLPVRNVYMGDRYCVFALETRQKNLVISRKYFCDVTVNII